jgi:hypothetical protein
MHHKYGCNIVAIFKGKMKCKETIVVTHRKQKTVYVQPLSNSSKLQVYTAFMLFHLFYFSFSVK